MMKGLFLLIVFFVGVQLCNAQKDTEFWFAVPEVTESHGDRPVYLRLTTFEQEANVSISIPASSSFVPIIIQIPANQLKSVELTKFLDELENKEADTILNKGLLIQSSSYISAYYEVKAESSGSNVPTNTDIFTLKGENALGQMFYVPFQNKLDNNYYVYGGDGRSSIDIIATEDSTDIMITPTDSVVGHSKDQSYRITLNKGQTYSIQAASQLAQGHLGGTKVVSNKSIAISMKDDSVIDNVLARWPSADLIGDQMIPIHLAGKEYVIKKGFAYMVATEDSTIVFADGVAFDTIDEGEQTFLSLFTDTPTYLTSTKPIVVLHTISQNGEHSGAILPPLQCTGSRKVSFVYDNELGFEITIIVKKGGENGFFMNGKKNPKFGPNVFTEIPNSDWMFYQGIFPSILFGTNSVSNPHKEFHLAIHNRTMNSTYYGYFSSFGEFDLGIDYTTCRGEELVLSAGEGRESYHWSTGDTTSTVLVPTENVGLQTIWVQVVDGVCESSDTVEVDVNEKVLGVDLLPSVEHCNSTTYSVSLPTKYQYLWNDGVATSNRNFEKSGLYIVEAKTIDDCVLRDTMRLELVKSPVLEMKMDTILCAREVWLISLPAYQNTSYKWHDGSEGASFLVSTAGDVEVTMTTRKSTGEICYVTNGKTNVDYWELNSYNVITPNGDDKNESFIIEGLHRGYWHLQVFNRWGGIVFDDKDYQNDWNAKGVSDGTYFYVLKEEKGQKCTDINGWVKIVR